MNPIVVHLISSVVCTTLDSSRVFPKFQVHFFVYRIQCFKYTSSILIYPYHLLSLSIKFSTLLKSVLIQVGFQTTAFLYPSWIRILFISIYLHSRTIPNNSLLLLPLAMGSVKLNFRPFIVLLAPL